MNETVSEARAAYLAARARRARRIRAVQIGILAASLAAWELAARTGAVDDFIVSSPSRIASTLSGMIADDLAMHVGVTLFETLAGFSIGAGLGLVIAAALWWSDFASRVAQPYLVVLNSLPKIALGPVIIILAGAGTRAIVFMALAISMIVTILEMLAGFRSTDAGSIVMARTFGATKRQIFFKIVLPSNLSTLFGSLKINIGLSLVGVIAGEFLVSKAGLGYLIVYGGQVFRMDLVMTGVILLSVMAALMYRAVSALEICAARRFGG